MADKKQVIEQGQSEVTEAKAQAALMPVFELRPFAKGQMVSLAMLKKLTEVPVPNGYMGIRQLNKGHVEALKIAYQQGEKLPPLILANTTHGVVLVAGYHRVQAMRDALLETLPSNDDGEVDKEQYKALLEKTFVTYVPAKASSFGDIVRQAFLDNLTHGLPPTSENRSRFALYLIAEAEKNGGKMTQQEAADIVHVSRVAIARMIMRDKGTVGITKRQILPADYVAEPEAQEVMEFAEQEAIDKKKQIDPLQDATLALFRAMQIVHGEMGKGNITPDELTSYFQDVAGKKLTGFTIDSYTFECLTQAIALMFKK